MSEWLSERRGGISCAKVGAHHPSPILRPGAEPSAGTIRVVTALSEIELLEPLWRRLTSPEAAPFQTFTWNLAWYRHYRNHYDSALVYLFEKEGAVLAILPCYRKGRMIRLAGDGIGDYQDILAVSAEAAREALDAIFHHVQEKARSLGFFFEKISSEGLLFDFFTRESGRRNDRILFWKRRAACPVVSIRGGMESYFRTLTSRRRQDLRRALRRFDRQFPGSRVEMIRNLEIRVADLESVAAFHACHFRKEGYSPLGSESLLGVLGEVAKDPGVGLQLGALVRGGDMYAVDVGFARGGRYYRYLTGFHQEFRKWAPGNCLLLKRIDAWVEEDSVETLDFLGGEGSEKNGFTHGEQYEVHSIHWMPKRFSGRARHAVLLADRLGRTLANRAVRKLVEAR